MGKYTTHEKVYLVEKYVKYKHKKCVRKFRLRFPMTPIPSKSSIVKLVKKWRKNGTVLGIGLRPRLRPHVSSKMFLVIKSLLDNEPSISIQDISKVTYLSRQVVKKVKKRIETDSIITHSMSQMAVECSKADISSSLLSYDKKHIYTSENIKAEPLSEVFEEETTVIKRERNTMSPETVLIKTEFPAPWSETLSQYILGD
uniref:DUF4817 domain-containing protein n=1 Tax=Timema cristinae TaxID=61476 RepID=A0A7R9GVA1_TIMCR|nr:unnamed protein product [Timema cristinae]